MDLPRRKIRDHKQLISILSQAIPSVQVITVQKQHELHVWPSEDKDGATIELAKIRTPEKVTTISIEHRDIEKVSKALQYLQRASSSMKVLNYVDCLRVWVEGKSLF